MVMPPACPIGPPTLFTRIEESTKPTLLIALERVAGAFFEFSLRYMLWLFRKRDIILFEEVIVSGIDCKKYKLMAEYNECPKNPPSCRPLLFIVEFRQPIQIKESDCELLPLEQMSCLYLNFLGSLVHGTS